jgi:hypothetical protein
MANSFKNSAVANIGTTASTVYTTPSATTSTVIGFTVANVSNSPITVNIYLTIGGSDFYLIKNAVIPVGGAIVPVGGEQKVVLQTGNLVKVLSSAATSADAILSVLEIS